MYGKELILDLHGCNLPSTREMLTHFFADLCKVIDMQREDLHFWDYEGDPKGYEEAPDHLKGISAIQFIRTSNITIHTIDVQKKVFLNIFSCKDFDSWKVVDFTQKYFGGNVAEQTVVNRL